MKCRRCRKDSIVHCFECGIGLCCVASYLFAGYHEGNYPYVCLSCIMKKDVRAKINYIDPYVIDAIFLDINNKLDTVEKKLDNIEGRR